ncbi:MAG: S41 family peptidase [Bacteroidia bacterium]|nr:S41 family peptidase [Bacteroidia bacterium]
MKSYIYISILILPILLFGACKEVLIPTPEANTILNNYDVFGQDFQEKYGLFKVKNFDWQEELKIHRADLEANPTEAGLYQTLTDLIDVLNDSHVALELPDRSFPFYDGGIYGRLERAGFQDTDLNLVRSKYVNVIDSIPYSLFYGSIEGNIGYLYLSEISDDPSFYEDLMPSILEKLKDTKGMIIDIRDNNGGEDEGGRTLASFFASKEAPYMISRYKTGIGPDDFEEDRLWTLSPYEGERYEKPLALLTNRYSVSAAETFSFAMKSQEQLVHVGDTTTGAFSDAVTRQLPNGWLYSISVGDYRDAENKSFESIGLAPDVLIKNTAADLAAGEDKMLEAAIQALQ